MTIAYSDALAALRSRLSAGAVAHSERVSDTAVRLAEAYGVDRDDARLAGLLHDWAKDLAGDALLAEAARLGIAFTPEDEAVPELLHARVGAAQVAEAFPEVPEDVLRAVEAHTLGAVDMSDLDRVVYIADALEPSRRYAGVEELRAEVGRVPLAELFLRVAASGIAYVVATRRRLHSTTVAVWNAALEEVASR